MSRQATAEAFVTDAPMVGTSLDDRTHYAHARYAATDEPGVIWYDPRDGREIFALPDVPADTDVTHDDKTLTRLKIHAKRAVCQVVDPAEHEWVLEYQYKTRETGEKPPGIDDIEFVTSYRGNEIYDTRAEAQQAAGEKCSAYADAEYRDAVADRTGGNND